MLFFFISCFFSFLLLSQSFLNPNPSSKIKSKMWDFPNFFLESLHRFLVSINRKKRIFLSFLQFPKFFKTNSRAEMEDAVEEKQGISVLDLPDLPLDCILEKLSPSGLRGMAGVCTYLREKCKSDHFWVKHFDQKWSKVIGDAAYREWQCRISTRKAPTSLNYRKSRLFSYFLDFFLNKSDIKERESGLRNPLAVNSVMSFYLALESGKFWFPAQVLNRENGHVGFMLSCYDAYLSYDFTTDNFVARFSVQGRRTIEADIEWSRVRAPGVDNPAEVLHKTGCLNELKPNDHIEIQWRRNKEYPYGWWYGVVGHLEFCSGNDFNCQCHIHDTIILEFKQYASGSRWRKIAINRTDHTEVGNEGDGFYGGIRKLYKDEEIAKWKQLWPKCTME